MDEKEKKEEEQLQEEKPKEKLKPIKKPTEKEQEEIRKAWQKYYADKELSAKERREIEESIKVLSQMGVKPIAGGAVDETEVREHRRKIYDIQTLHAKLGTDQAEVRRLINEEMDLIKVLHAKEVMGDEVGEAKSIDEAVGEQKDKMNGEQFKFYTEQTAAQAIQQIQAQPNLNDREKALLHTQFTQRLQNLASQNPETAKDEYAKVLSDVLKSYANVADLQGSDAQGSGEDIGVLTHRAELTEEEKEKIIEFLHGDYSLAKGLGDDPIVNEANLTALRGSEQMKAILSDPSLTRKEREALRNRHEEILNNPNTAEIAPALLDFYAEVGRKFAEEKANEDIDSVQDLFKYIALTQNRELYDKGGRYELIDADGKLHPENFMIWLRDYSVKKHWDNSNDPMSPLSAVGIETRLGPRNIYTMTREARERFFRDKDTGIVLHDLADAAMTEAWLFGVYRNSDLAYRQIMHDDSELPKINAQIHSKNDLTRGNNLASTLSIAEKFGERHDTRVGDAIMFANDIYYNISDQKELDKILGKHKFTKDDFVNAIKILQKKKDWEDIDDYVGTYDKNDPKGFYYLEENVGDIPGRTVKHYLFNEDGSLNFAAYRRMNYFVTPTEKLSTIALFRELVRVKINQKFNLGYGMEGHGTDIAMKRDEYEQVVQAKGQAEADRQYMARREADRINLEYAEIISNSQQRPYGIGAKNDELRRAHDAQTKLLIKEYLLRQSRETTAGPIGIPQELSIFNSLSTDYWTGLKTESGRSPYELFLQIRDLNNSDLDPETKAQRREEIMGQLRFREVAEQDYATNQQGRAFQLFESLSGAQTLDLDKIVTQEIFEGVKYNPGEFEKQVKDGFIKPLRYAFSSNAGLKYSQKLRYYDRGEYRDGRLADKIFGPAVIGDIREQVKAEDARRRERGGSDLENWEAFLNGRDLNNEEDLADISYEWMDTGAGRIRLVKNAARARIAAELKFHREHHSVGQMWRYARTDTFINALKTLRAYSEDREHPGEIHETGNAFFSKEDIEWIRKQSGTETWRMLIHDFWQEGLLEGGLLHGLLGGSMKAFFEGTFK